MAQNGNGSMLAFLDEPLLDLTLEQKCGTEGEGTAAVHTAGDAGASSAETGETGGSQAHDNMPPYYTMCYIMKVDDTP